MMPGVKSRPNLRPYWLGVTFGLSLFLVFSHAATASPVPRKNVLLLNSYRPGYAWTDGLVRSVESVLNGKPYEIEYWVEYLDAGRISGKSYLDGLKDVYQRKYSGKSIDLIIATDDEALSFLLNYPDFLTTTPVVF